jgi:hypothetical protein
LRTLIKQGHQGALALIGYSAKIDIDFNLRSITKKVAWGGSLAFEFLIKNNIADTQKLLVDFQIGFQKKDGSISNKVFKLGNVALDRNQEIILKKTFSFKPITTRIYYPGTHLLLIQVNGHVISKNDFMLLKA